MTRAQRLLWILGLTVPAVVLHVAFCDWVWRAPGHELIFGATHAATVPNRPYDVHSGLLAANHATFTSAVLFGLGVPWALLLLAGHLALGWRAASRRDRGACPRCGYELHHDLAAGCPECGWRRA